MERSCTDSPIQAPSCLRDSTLSLQGRQGKRIGPQGHIQAPSQGVNGKRPQQDDSPGLLTACGMEGEEVEYITHPTKASLPCNMLPGLGGEVV